MNPTSTFFGFFTRLISKNDPLSSMRWCFVFTFILLNSTFWVVWASISIAHMRMEDVPSGLWIAYGGALTVVTGFKALEAKWQKEEETKVKRDEGLAEVAINKEETK